MRPASRLLPPRLGAFFEMARLRKQGVATVKCVRPQAASTTVRRALWRALAEGQRAAASDAARERREPPGLQPSPTAR